MSNRKYWCKPMRKGEVFSRVNNLLHENNVKKEVSIRRVVFHISDDYDNRADFYIPQKNKQVEYTAQDVENILTAFALVTYDAIRHGESCGIPSYWQIEPRKRAGRLINAFGTGELVETPTTYYPKFIPGPKLREAAQLYGMEVEDIESDEDEDEDALDDLSGIDNTFGLSDEEMEYVPAVKFVEHTEGDVDVSDA